MKKQIVMVGFLVISMILFHSCKGAPLGSPSNPIKFWFMPLKEASVFEANAPKIEQYLEKETGYAIKITPASSFIDIVKALGQKKADIAFMNTLGFLLARDWAGTEALLQYVYGDVYKSYRGEIITRIDTGIEKPGDLNDKSFAFVSPYSAGGYLYALKYLKDNNIKPSKTEFAGGHYKAVEKVYLKKVDAAATYHERPSSEGTAKDARAALKSKYPDILNVVKIVALTSEIPNGPVTARKGLSKEMNEKITAALLNFARTAQGRTALIELYNMTGLAPVNESVYDDVSKVIKEMGKTIQDMVPGGAPYYRTWIVPGLE